MEANVPNVTGKPFCPIAAIAAPETFRRARLADENPARVSWRVKGGARAGSRNPHSGCWEDFHQAKHPGRGECSSRNFRHEQPVGHALLEVPDHAGLGAWN